ncbi:unnamed protein product (macronuclear) [Paramecium tetraurelia]|uniref:Uncharacterized protein n=1 Tax=Paramecium tetraurelia TaxID=5888 RepID=A0E3Q8_PARTE|nr:uncharacterized protein GSPATT00023098001 [Paramecium tetraurelia]CAK89925.1 unnamed protein product [Paramecium tetraurelia]|eukprot:XP_001457322.1 hypothetical protein (macronuclear) [Paramecium tetraurelia strain d4-2]
MQQEIYKDRTAANENTQQIKAAETLQSLVQYVNDLTEIVNEVKLKNQAEFILAYQSHMKKIKAELEELKYKTEEQKNSMVLNKVKAISNDNELTLFRQECLKLYEKIEQKNKEIQELKFTLQESKKTNEFLESQIKGLMKKLKLQEIERQQQPTPSVDQIFCTTAPTNHFKVLKRKLTDYQSKLDISSSLTKHHYASIRELFDSEYNQKDEELIEKISKYVSQIEQKYQKQIQALNQKANNLLISQNKKSVIRSDLESFFLDCVETVRRDILKKKRPFGTNQQLQASMEHISDFSQFHKEDKLKILELVVSNEKILVFLYQKLFPNHVNLVIKSIREDVHINNFLDESVKCDSSNKNHRSGDYKTDFPKTTREVRSASLNKQLEVKKGKLLFKQY